MLACRLVVLMIKICEKYIWVSESLLILLEVNAQALMMIISTIIAEISGIFL